MAEPVAGDQVVPFPLDRRRPTVSAWNDDIA